MNLTLLLILCVLSLVCVWCAGCETKGQALPEKAGSRSATFRVALREFGPFAQAIQREWASFQKASGTRLELQAVSMDHHPLYEALFSREELKRGDWDVAFITTDWLAEARETNAVVDLGPALRSNPPEDYPDGWTPSLLRLQQFGDQVLGLPYHDGPECLIYRTDLFDDPDERRTYQERYGEELRVPETWDAFLRVARFFTRPERKLYGTVFAAYPDGHNTVYDICLQLWTRGGELFDSDGALQLDTPQMVEALTFYRAIVNDTSAVHPDSREFDSVKSGMAFARGEVAMMVNWFGFASMCETIEESVVRRRVAIAPLPHAPGCASASLNVYWLVSVAAGSPHRTVAYAFLRHVMSRENDKLRTLDGVIGCRLSTWADEAVNAVIPFYRTMKDIHVHARELPRLTNWVEQSAVIDAMVLKTIDTGQPIEAIVREAQARATR
jgi:multiple sugar transport system substrate-binding protein